MATVNAAGKNAGLATVADTVLSPTDAFRRLSVAPTWGWAYLATVVACAIGTYLSSAATAHAVSAGWSAQVAANPQLAAMTPQQQQRALSMANTFVHYVWLITPISVLVAAALQTLILLVFKAIGKSAATFKQLWCLSMNTLLVGLGLYTLLAGIIAVVRGAAAYNSNMDVVRAVPSLAWLVPHASIKLVAFLAAFNVIAIWGAVLVAIGMIAVARVSKANAYAAAFTITLLAGCFYGLTAK
jgi:Yip1 domain